MTTRGDQVYALLRAYVAYAGGLRTSTGQIVSRGAIPGEQATRTIDCPVCKGTGRRRRRGVSSPCDQCVDKNGKPTGRVRIDAYTGRQRTAAIKTEPFTAKQMSQWETDTELALSHIESLLRMNEGSEAAHDAFSAAYETGEKLLAQGSYPDLRLALAWLRDKHPVAHSLIWQAVIYASFGPPEGGVRSACEAVCETLAAKMPERIDVPPWARDAATWRDSKESLWRGQTPAHTEKRAARDNEIRAQHTNGTPVSSIVANYALKKTQVYDILAASCASGAVTVR